MTFLCDGQSFINSLCINLFESSNMFFSTLYYIIKIDKTKSLKLRNTLKDVCENENG